ncbi:hypothetical protein FVB32_04910 [Flagellimonas hymeniacidonis]|uniref:Uncharacterized protein n=1 Tax=Flagellimonas hymeniacidonis TaxID=2603628 RepID=A0A5C8V7F4_9FLAO|nr:hypothetical protein [Flagellimonas hymeniacidonis]TXN37632.1 hypothetical protein FVB32_04910 [Flagellimonas hymeniacidonis]
MAGQPANNNNSDEIDLGQLFQMIGRGFNKIGIAFLRTFLYLKKNALILGILVIVGVGLGYGLNQISRNKLKIEVIVKPNLESKNYLYDVVAELESNIRAKDSVFFKNIGADVTNLKELKITIEPIEDGKKGEGDLEYLELLEKFQTNDEFLDLIKSELSNKTSLNHRITFFFKNPSEGKLFAQKVMEYINSNEYFNELVDTSNKNALERIERNETFIKQIDELISIYSKSFNIQSSQNGDGRIVLDNNEKMNVTGLFSLKNQLIKNTEQKKIEVKEQKQAINIINLGNVQRVKRTLFSKATVLVPGFLVGLFFAFSAIRFLNKKAFELSI